MQRHVPRGETDDRRNIEKQVAKQLRLFHFAIDARLQARFSILQPCRNRRAKRPERIRPLGAPPLQIITLPIALAHVVAACVAEDVIQGVGLGDSPRRLANHDDEFAFVMDILRARRNHYLAAWLYERGDGLEEEFRLCRRRASPEMALEI